MWEYEIVTKFGVIQLKANNVIITADTVIFKKHGVTIAEFYIDRIAGWVRKE